MKAELSKLRCLKILPADLSNAVKNLTTFMSSKHPSFASDERINFRSRLIEALRRAKVEPRPTAFALEFNLRSPETKVTVHAARKWLVGEAIPTQEKLIALSRWLNVSSQWLRFGEDAPNEVPAPNDGAALPHAEILMLSDFRRLDERSQTVVRELISILLKHHLSQK